MDYEAALISRLLKDKDLNEVLDLRVTDALFITHPELWKYIVRTQGEHGGFPPLELLKKKFPDFEYSDEDIPVSFLVDELMKRHIHNIVMDSMKTQAEYLKIKDPRAALEEMRSSLLKADVDTRPSKDLNFSEDLDERLKLYEKAQLSCGITGIPTPWDCLNEVIHGFQSEEIIMVAGRGGVGKSWMELVLALDNWKNGYIPLLFTREMAVWQIARRSDSIYAKLPYNRFKSGQLTTHEVERWKEAMEMLKGSRPFWITGDDGDGTLGVTGVAAKIHRYKPHIVYIDGVYMIKDDRGAKSKWEQFSNVCQDLKRLAQREKIPIVVTHQFNAAGKGEDGTEDTLKFGDVQKWFDLIIGCYRTEEMRQKDEMLLKVLKHREGEQLSWYTNWNLDSMEFDAKPTEDEIREGAEPYEKEEPVKF